MKKILVKPPPSRKVGTKIALSKTNNEFTLEKKGHSAVNVQGPRPAVSFLWNVATQTKCAVFYRIHFDESIHRMNVRTS